MKRLVLILLLTAVSPLVARSETYYIAPDGKENDAGSKEQPWPSVRFALSKIGGGHTLLLLPGVYRGPIQIGKAHAGTETSPTVIRSEVKWKAIINGSPRQGIYVEAGGHWVVIDGFLVLGAMTDGILALGGHNVVRNCWIRNNGQTGIQLHPGGYGTMQSLGGIIENNLVEFNGHHVQFHHGIYAGGQGLEIRNNIVRHNAGFGMYLYPAIKASRIAGNLVHGHANKSGMILVCPEGGGQNAIVNNTISDGLEIWKGDGELIANNILTAKRQALLPDKRTRSLKVDYNLCVPKSPQQGPHGLTGDPKFVDPEHGVFWLRPDSPAIGRATRQHAPKSDFWDRPRAPLTVPDVGAFAFAPHLTTSKARATWHLNWAYGRDWAEGRDMPDLWAPPSPASDLRVLKTRIKHDRSGEIIEVNLQESRTTDEDLVHLVGLARLKELSLHRTRITSAGLVSLRGLTNLQRLFLSDTQTGDDGLASLKHLRNLDTLGLSGTKVTDVGLEHLKGLKNLRYLYMIGTDVTEEGVKRLGRSLPKCDITR